MAPLVSHCKVLCMIEARAYHQNPCFEAGVQFARAEGIVPAPETTHAIRAAIDEALKAREEGKSPTILFNLSGHGHFDMQAYTDYFAGKLLDQDYDPKALESSLSHLPKVAAESPRRLNYRAKCLDSPHREVPKRAPDAALRRSERRRPK
jgi:tryptophan synthase beta chain